MPLDKMLERGRERVNLASELASARHFAVTIMAPIRLLGDELVPQPRSPPLLGAGDASLSLSHRRVRSICDYFGGDFIVERGIGRHA